MARQTVMSATVASFCLLAALPGRAKEDRGRQDYVPQDYVWTTQSRNSSESMPCGGHDIGLNVWVENGDVLFYIQQSGWFDENNTLLKAGRWRLRLGGHPFSGEDFEQRLCLADGAIYIKGKDVKVRLWADVEAPEVYVAIASGKRREATLRYESWRYRDRPVTKAECQQCSYKWTVAADCMTRADSIGVQDGWLRVEHTNREETVFDHTVAKEHLDELKTLLYNPLGGRKMSATMLAKDFRFEGIVEGLYASTDYKGWNFRAKDIRRSLVKITIDNWEKGQTRTHHAARNAQESRERSARWWREYWQRSWIQTDNAEAAPMVRNYELMRYMLGCNARGEWPTKFNGGLFTFDPIHVDGNMPFTPDYRKWGGGTMTAQNQRLVYWPLLKSGDTDLLAAQLDTYLRLLPTAQLWARRFWGHGGACFTEQLENFGLPNPAEYGKHKEGEDLGVEHNKWLEYEWDTALEFCLMAAHLKAEKYRPLIEECVRFFHEHYPVDSLGRLAIYPGSGCETFKMARNACSTVAALLALAKACPDMAGSKALPPIPLRIIDGDTCIAPAEHWERVQNVETPQLYPVFPWRIYGLGQPGLQTALNTYRKDPHAVEMRSAKGWKQDNIWAACLGLTDEAKRLNMEKLADGPYRFPAFYAPGFDWAPDHNRGGAGMIGLQEMLLQETPTGEPLLFPAWPREWDACFRLYTTDGKLVEAEIKHGVVTMAKKIHKSWPVE